MQKPLGKQNYSAPIANDPLGLVVPADCAGLRLDQALARLLPEHSRSRLTRWVRDHRVSVEGRTADPSDTVWGGERLRIDPPTDPKVLAHLPEDIPLDVVYEDETLIVINKPPGLVVHPGSGNWEGTLLNALLQHAPGLAEVPRAGIVHRLDKDTSGLLVVAKTLTAQTDLVRQLQARTVRRIYVALARGVVARDGKVEAPIGRHPVSRTRMAVVARGKPAVTHYHVLARYADATLLECRLETGRTHQIRVHLASIGHPIVGDPVYGKRTDKRADTFERQALHAHQLGLNHPASREPMTWHAPVPDDMRRLIQTFEAHASHA
ncbi:MAG TPA: 23S rRNA pseudouridine(1911/1915/1917) synthase RluD [Burkholderiales bacterium]|jgi:23S rRNA pseudouridine1911/1915/1917 synthase|nr:23S rRNA pseudouridine(1911/1915/1917) synthase RluD [Burkholderiales bacterium]